MNLKYDLTIGIVSYNRPKELLRALESLLPIPDNVEVLICDDKSPKLEEIITTIDGLIRHENIRFISNDNNLGYDRNLYQVVELASAEYVMLLGDDDYFEEGTVKSVLNYLSSCSDFYCGFVNFKSIDKNNTVFYERDYSTNKYFDENTLNRDGSFLFNSILFSGLIFSKKAIELNNMDFSKYYKSIYIQVSIFVKLNLKYGSHFIKGPGVIIGGDGESGFGHNEASSTIDNDLKDRSSVISNLSYHKRLFGVIRCLTQETEENIFQPFNREYKIRSIKAFYLARKFGRKYALNYWNELRKVKAENIALLYPIYGLLVLLPASLIHYPVKKIENSITYYRNRKSKKY